MKKSVIFIVEGSTDKDALENILKKIYKGNKEIVFIITSGDITTNSCTTLDNICEKIYEFVLNKMKEYKLKKPNIWQIVHIFDMDGAYVDDSLIKLSSESKFVYTETDIFCSDVNRVVSRNNQKRTIMDKLLIQKDIKGISYKCYYFSCNLDHALYNKLNLTKDEKSDYAHEFTNFFSGRENLFINFLESDVVNGVPDSYIKSWEYIKNSPHSLERHTNLHLFFKDNPIL